MNASRISSLPPIPPGLLSRTGFAQGGEGAPLSRAEVLADLQIWQQSGMARFDNGEASADPADAAFAPLWRV